MGCFFYHGIRETYDAIAILYQIMKTKEIKSKRRLRYDEEDMYGFNGLDYVSVCKKEDSSGSEDDSIHAYDTYVQNHFCLILRDDLPVIKPEVLTLPNGENYDREWIRKIGASSTRYTDMVDEWQVKDTIPFSYVVGIGIPMKNLSHYFCGIFTIVNLVRFKKILAMIEALGLDIIDSSQPNFAENYEKEKQVEKEKRIAINVKL